jgi:hypothetical protein
MPFYNSITIKLKNDGFAHQLALMPAFTLLPDTSNKRVIVRDINADFQQIMLLNVNDCGSSEPMMLDNIRFAEANPCGNNAILTDTRDGNEYRTYAIGNQCWTTTNLRYGNADNKQIFLETDNENKLYNWNFGEVKMNPQTKKFETMPISTNVCPAGWHVPTSADFQELITFYQNYGSPNLLRNIFKSQENMSLWMKN